MEIKIDKIELVNVSMLNPNPLNRNSHSKEQISELARHYKVHGMRTPIIVSKQSGFIVAGNGRFLAAKKAGMIKIPVSYQDFETPDKEYAFGIADNGLSSWSELDLSSINVDIQNMGPDFDVNDLGIKDFVIEPADKYADKDADEIPDVAQNSRGVKLGDIYQLGNHRLMCGDSTKIEDVQKLMNGKLADLWIADPPFGVSYMEKNAAVNGGIVKNQTGKEIKSDTKSVEELCPFWEDSAKCAYEVTTMEASNYWCACQGSDKMMMMMMMMDKAGWNIRHELIWVKDSFVFGRSDYHYRHEPIIYGWKKKGKHNFYGDRTNDSVFETPRPKKSDLHPTTKPVELFSHFITNSSKVNDLIFESFGGSGTTLIAAEKLNRKSNSMELDPHYCSVIIERWEKFTGQKAQIVSN